MSSKFKPFLRSFAILGVLAIAAYFAHTEYQSHLGRQALEATGLEVHSLEQALAKSKETGKPVLADLSAIWSPSCRRLDETVLAHESVKAKIETDYIFARIEYESDEGQAFMRRHGLRGFPNLLTLDGEGEKLKALPRTFDPSEFLHAL